MNEELQTVIFEHRVNASDIPNKMRHELRYAKTADQADRIFREWSPQCDVDPRDRAHVWKTA